MGELRKASMSGCLKQDGSPWRSKTRILQCVRNVERDFIVRDGGKTENGDIKGRPFVEPTFDERSEHDDTSARYGWAAAEAPARGQRPVCRVAALRADRRLSASANSSEVARS
jgi:hypothetical protein